MKRLICCVLLVFVLILSGCSGNEMGSNSNQTTDDSSTSRTESSTTGLQKPPQDEYNSHNVVLPKIAVSSKNIAGIFQSVKMSNITVIDAIGDKYYGYKSTYSENGVNDTFVLSDPHSGEDVELNSSDHLDNWEVGSGSTIVLNDRYLYEWKGYTTVSSEDGYDVKLTRIDAENGNIEIVDEIMTKILRTFLISSTTNWKVGSLMSSSPRVTQSYLIDPFVGRYEITDNPYLIYCIKSNERRFFYV